MAQARYLEDIKQAQAILDKRLVKQARPRTSFEQIVTVAGAKPSPVKPGRNDRGWYEIPEMMNGAVIFAPTKDQQNDGVVRFVVHENTKIGLAASWAYDGNASGGWQEERKSKSDLEKSGWVKQGKCI